jgi:hypothetical protein
MSLPTSLHAYEAEVNTFDQALASERGIKIPFGELTRARRFVMRLHQCRKLHRIENAKSLPADSPLHNHSEWDPLICRVAFDDPDKPIWVIIEKARSTMAGIEPL